MKATPEESAYYEKLAIARGGSVRYPVCGEVRFVAGGPHAPVDPGKITEKDFQQAVIDLAHDCGFKVAHFRKSRTKQGWCTAVAADGKGFTDLVLVRERIIWAELKIPPNKLTPDQENWRDWLLAARQEWYCWTPVQWPEILETLK